MWICIALCCVQVLLIRYSRILMGILFYKYLWNLSWCKHPAHSLLQCSASSKGLGSKKCEPNQKMQEEKRLSFCKWVSKAVKNVNQERNIRISHDDCRYWLEGLCFPKASMLYRMILCRWSRVHPRGEAIAMHGFPESMHQLPICKLNITYQLLTFRKRWLQSIHDAIVKLDENSKST